MSVICHVGKHPQLYLRIVGVYKQTPFLCREETAKLSPQLLSHRNVLKIRLGRAYASGSGFGLIKGGVYSAVGRYHRKQSLHIGGFELGKLTVFKKRPNGVKFLKLFQHLGVCGKAAFGLFLGRKAEFDKKGVGKLFGRIKVKLITHRIVYRPLKPGNSVGQGLSEFANALCVDQKTFPLHIAEHKGKGHFYIFKKLLLLFVRKTELQNLIKTGKYSRLFRL